MLRYILKQSKTAISGTLNWCSKLLDSKFLTAPQGQSPPRGAPGTPKLRSTEPVRHIRVKRFKKVGKMKFPRETKIIMASQNGVTIEPHHLKKRHTWTWTLCQWSLRWPWDVLSKNVGYLPTCCWAKHHLSGHPRTNLGRHASHVTKNIVYLVLNSLPFWQKHS